MPVTRPLFASPASSRPEHARDPKPFSGWAMAKAAALDRAGARGLVADLLTASTLRRQAAFVVLATVSTDEPRPFLEDLSQSLELVVEWAERVFHSEPALEESQAGRLSQAARFLAH